MRCLCGRVLLVVAMLCGFAAHSEAWAGIGNLWYDGPYVGDSPEAACAPVMARNGWELDHIDVMLSRGEAACKPTYESAMRTWGYYTWTVAFFNGGACAPGYTQLPEGNCEPNRSPERSCAVGHPVLPGTGTKVLNERDDSGSSELPLTRSYRSNVLFGGASGTGQWTFNWQRRLDPAMSLSMYGPSVRVLREDGSVLIFRKDATGWVAVGTRDRVQPSYDANGYITDWKYTVASTGTIERYDAAGKLLRVEERNGRGTVLAYNSKNLLSQVQAISGRSLTFAHDSQGRIASATAPDGAITRYAYNTAGMLSTVTWPDNTTRQYVYEDTRSPTALTGVIDEAGVRYATYAYDDQGRAITSELTGGADRYQFQYLSNGQTTVLLPDGGSSVYGFLKQNGILLPTGTTAPCALCGSTAQGTDYDSNGNATRKVGYDGAVTTYAYDALGRQVQRVDAAGTTNATTFTTEWHPTWNLPVRAASPGRLETFAYDTVGNLVSYTTVATNDASGVAGFRAAPMGDVVKTDWTYDGAGRLVTASELTGTVVTGSWALSYDAQGNVQTLTDSNGRTATAVKYDAAGRLLEAVNTDGERTKYSYNARGLLLSHDVDGAVVNYDYDANGLLTAIRGPGDYYFGFQHDAAHRLTALLAPVGQAPLASTANPVQAAKLAATAEVLRTAKLSMIERLWITAKSWFSRLLGLVVGNAAANPLLGTIRVVPPIPAQVGGAIGGTSGGDRDLDELLGTGRPMPRPDPLLNEFIKMVRNITGANQGTSEACEDDSRCQSAKRDASSQYWTLTQKRIPQYLSGGTGGHDAGHYKAIIERQNGLRKAINKVKLYCRPLPAELPEWERVANQEIPILH